ncbi:DUF6460 domain-containing protein [Coralliovum pocilloporae]|uniref:DUF6460 domain-containing protein n=1 Tax=Coralliovum pocilloporae TaxID=3066369 RepID=UPI0033071745
MSSNTLNRFLGGSPGAVLVRLILLSLMVGFILSAIDIHPLDIFDWVVDFFKRIYEMGFEAIEWAVQYFLLGAIIVVPIWLIMRITRFGRRD